MAAPKSGNSNRGGSSGFKVIKVGPQKADLNHKPKAKPAVKNHGDLKRDGRHVAHKPSISGGKLKFSHMDIAAKDKRDGNSVTRSISLRSGH